MTIIWKMTEPYFSSKQQSSIRLPLCMSSCNHRALSVFVIPAASYCFIAKASLKTVYPEVSLQNTDNLEFVCREHTVQTRITRRTLCAVRMYYLGFIQGRLMIAICRLAKDAHKGALQGQQTTADKARIVLLRCLSDESILRSQSREETTDVMSDFCQGAACLWHTRVAGAWQW